MTQVNELTSGQITAKIIQNPDGTFLVEYADHETGHFVNAGMFSTQALAEAKATVLIEQERISAEDLVGDVPVAE